jgi:transmembrane sensor
MEETNNTNSEIIYYHDDDDKQLQVVYPGIKIPWNKSKENYWDNIENKIGKAANKGRFLKIISFSAAASVLLFISIFAVTKSSSTSVKTAYGVHQTVLLPDGSEVILNAGSELTYHKWKWAENREVNLKGEAFFKVKKGDKFLVKTLNGTVSVLGTSFNVYDRENVFQVACISGRVRVSADNSNETVLNPNQKFNLNEDHVEILRNIDSVKELSWINNSFAFNAVPLRDVFKEIERQYNVRIEYHGDFRKSYSGVFPKSSIENVLDIVCRPFGYKYQTIKENEFIITNNNNF